MKYLNIIVTTNLDLKKKKHTIPLQDYLVIVIITWNVLKKQSTLWSFIIKRRKMFHIVML